MMVILGCVPQCASYPRRPHKFWPDSHSRRTRWCLRTREACNAGLWGSSASRWQSPLGRSYPCPPRPSHPASTSSHRYSMCSRHCYWKSRRSTWDSSYHIPAAAAPLLLRLLVKSPAVHWLHTSPLWSQSSPNSHLTKPTPTPRRNLYKRFLQTPAFTHNPPHRTRLTNPISHKPRSQKAADQTANLLPPSPLDQETPANTHTPVSHRRELGETLERDASRNDNLLQGFRCWQRSYSNV